MKISNTNAIDFLKSLKEQAENIDNYKDSFFADERSAAEYNTEELINELLAMDLEEDASTKDNLIAGTIKLELTEHEAKIVSMYLQSLLPTLGLPETERAFISVLKKIAKGQGYESV